LSGVSSEDRIMQEDTPKKSISLSALQAADLYRMQVRELRTYAMFMLDPQGIITSWNAGVEHLLGYSEDEWVGQHACKIFTPTDKAVEMCESEMKLAQETGSATDIRWAPSQKRNRVFLQTDL
jgi:PAS domain S-box-containing protein